MAALIRLRADDFSGVDCLGRGALIAHRLLRRPLRIDSSRLRAVSAVGSAIWADSVVLAEALAAAASVAEARAAAVPDVQALRAAAVPAGRGAAAPVAAAVAVVSAAVAEAASAAVVAAEAVPAGEGNDFRRLLARVIPRLKYSCFFIQYSIFK